MLRNVKPGYVWEGVQGGTRVDTRHRNRKHICSVGGWGDMLTNILPGKSEYKQTITPALAAHAHL